MRGRSAARPVSWRDPALARSSRSSASTAARPARPGARRGPPPPPPRRPPGGLRALPPETGLQDLATESGVPIHADLRAELLATIFYRGTALHDGAVVISGEEITAAGVLLPMSQTALDSERYGTRHRAAIGISEQTDAIVVVVSEETGSISLVIRGRIERNLTEDQLRRRIFNLIRPQAPRGPVPFLRRSNDGRWHLGAADEEEAAGPIDPDARVVSAASDRGALRR